MQGLSRKRQRAEIQQEPGPNDAFAVLSTGLLYHFLNIKENYFLCEEGLPKWQPLPSSWLNSSY